MKKIIRILCLVVLMVAMAFPSYAQTMKAIIVEDAHESYTMHLVYDANTYSGTYKGKKIIDQISGVTKFPIDEYNSLEWTNRIATEYVKHVVIDKSFANARPTSTRGWFSGLYHNRDFSGLQYLNTSNVTDMAYMFNNCKASSIDLSHFNTSKVKTMAGMFAYCMITDKSISESRPGVHDFDLWFPPEECNSLNFSNFNTSNVTDMSGMFSNISVAYLDLGSFNTGNVTNMEAMFWSCSTKSINVSSFNTAKVYNMSCMFTTEKFPEDIQKTAIKLGNKFVFDNIGTQPIEENFYNFCEDGEEGVCALFGPYMVIVPKSNPCLSRIKALHTKYANGAKLIVTEY